MHAMLMGVFDWEHNFHKLMPEMQLIVKKMIIDKIYSPIHTTYNEKTESILNACTTKRNHSIDSTEQSVMPSHKDTNTVHP